MTLSTAMNLSAEILFRNFHIFHNILLNLANFEGVPVPKSMQIPNKKIETVRNHVKTVGTCEKHL